MKKKAPNIVREGVSPITDDARLSEDELLAAIGTASPADRMQLLNRLFEQHYERVLKWSLHLTGNETEALDLAQEVFVKAQLAVDRFRHDSSVSTWLHVITRRTFLDRIRSDQRKTADTLDDQLAMSLVDQTRRNVIDRIDAKQRGEELREVIAARLEADERQALYLKYVEGLSTPEITRRMALDNPSGAKALIVSAFRKLRAHYDRNKRAFA